MTIRKLRLENFRGFEGVHEFELHSDHINVIIGANGAGKTSVLDALSYPIYKIFDNANRQIEGKNFHNWKFNFDFKPNITFGHLQSSLNVSLEEKQELYKLSYNFIDRGNNVIDTNFHCPVFNLSSNFIFREYFTVRELYTKNYNDHSSFSNWYREQINIQNNEIIKDGNWHFRVPSISNLNRAENIFLQALSENNFRGITLDKSRYEDRLVLFIEKSNGRKIEYHQLSSGEKTIFAMLLEIAQDTILHNPKLENPLLASGIVLIDEIELHLHPKWQTSILQALNKTFPNIQFIVTTHSPLVINHLKNENLILLDDFKITEGINVQSVYGRDVNSIITDFMGASAKPKEVENLINDIEFLLDEEKPDISLAKEKLEKLKGLTSPNHSEALKLETLITIEED